MKLTVAVVPVGYVTRASEPLPEVVLGRLIGVRADCHWSYSLTSRTSCGVSFDTSRRSVVLVADGRDGAGHPALWEFVERVGWGDWLWREVTANLGYLQEHPALVVSLLDLSHHNAELVSGPMGALADWLESSTPCRASVSPSGNLSVEA